QKEVPERLRRLPAPLRQTSDRRPASRFRKRYESLLWPTCNVCNRPTPDVYRPAIVPALLPTVVVDSDASLRSLRNTSKTPRVLSFLHIPKELRYARPHRR